MSGVRRTGKTSLNMPGNVASPVMSDGFVLGSLAALAWGLADVSVTYLSRRGGFFTTLLYTQTAGVALLVVVALALDDLPGASGAELVLGESLTALQALGCVLVLGFIGLAALEPGGGRAEEGANGIRLALVTALSFGIYLFGLATISEELGWLLPILVARTAAVAILAAVAAARPPPRRGSLGRLGVLGCMGAGALGAARYPPLKPGGGKGGGGLPSAAGGG